MVRTSNQSREASSSSAPSQRSARPGAGSRRWFAALTVLLSLGVAELGARAYFAWGPPIYERTRQRLAGEVRANWRRFVPQPYLLYISGPGYANAAGPQHNEAGYRGAFVPLRRRPGVPRVLCMGGSTTYSSRVASAAQTYPAQLERLLEARAPTSKTDVEVINAGLPSGTTAEIVTQWIFKFHLYHPDVVVIHTGGNDAAAFARPGYQPDYSHWRTTFQVPRPFAAPGRALLRSRLAAIFLILLTQGADPRVTLLELPEGQAPPARWFEAEHDDQGRMRLKSDEIGFLHNLDTVTRLMLAQGAKVLLVPFRPAPDNGYPPPVLAAMRQNEDIMGQVAKVVGVPMAPFPQATISPENWVDFCHVNAAGAQEKATYLAPFVARLLWPGSSSSGGPSSKLP